ncbi:MAG: hypothetical protein ABIO44_07450 [Saprospiraceae bacterium]
MKTFFLILLSFLFINRDWAQIPQGFSFQGIANDMQGKPAVEKDIKVEIKLLQGSSNGQLLYAETHTVHTNVNGLYSLSVGLGTPTFKLFSEIAWKNSPIFISVGIDINNGMNFNLAGTTQLLSVPYALYAEQTNNNSCQLHLILSGNISDQDATKKIKEHLGPCTKFIWVQNTTKLTSIDLSGIDHLVELRIENNKSLREVKLPDLIELDIDVSIVNNPLLVKLDLKALTSVHGSTVLTNNGLDSLYFPLLGNVDANLVISENVNLTTVILPNLQETGSIILYSNSKITELSCLKLIKVDGEVKLSYNTILINFSMPMLQEVGNLTLSYNTLLISCSMPMLKVVGNLTLHYNEVMNSLQLPQLKQISDVLSIDYCIGLITLDFPSLTSVKNIEVFGNSLLNSSEFPNLLSIKSLYFVDNESLNYCNTPMLSKIDQITFIRNPKLYCICVPKLENVNEADIEYNDNLTKVEWPILTRAKVISINYNKSLNSINSNSLIKVDGLYSLGFNEALLSFALPQIDFMGGVSIALNKNLGLIDLSHLNEAVTINIYNNEKLLMVKLDNLGSITGVDGSFNCTSNTNLKIINLSSIKSVISGSVLINSNSFSSNQINSILKIFSSITPIIQNYSIDLSSQSPPAPPTGAGVLDKEFLIMNANNVITD